MILFHLDAGLMRSGYLGVDIFFVISGYVVTLSVLRGATDGAWDDARRFWLRRVMRIVPALALVVFIGLLLHACLWPPFPREVYQATIRTGLAALFGASNWYLHRSGEDYFLENQTPNIFLHTWSLGIEEQFYVIFSLSIMLLPQLLFRRAYRDRFRMLAVMFGAIVSLWIWVVMSTIESRTSFYLIYCRYWELSIGVLLAMRQVGRARDRLLASLSKYAARLPLLQRLLQTLSALSLPLLVTLLVIAPADDAKQRMTTVLAAVALSAALVAFPPRTNHFSARVLQSGLLRYLGKISYSLYLFHWLVIVACRHTIGIDTTAAKGFVVSATIISASLAYRYVENPLRHGSQLMQTYRLKLLAVAFASVVLTGAVIQSEPGALYMGQQQDWAQDWVPSSKTAYASGGLVIAEHCNVPPGSLIPDVLPEACFSRARTSDGISMDARRTFLVGDSHAFSNWGMLVNAAEHSGELISTFVNDGCSLDRPQLLTSCQAYWDSVPRWATKELRRGDVLFVTFSWAIGSARPNERVLPQLTRLAALSQEIGARLVIQAPMPLFTRPAYMCLPEAFRFDYTGCSIPYEAFDVERAPAMAVLSALQAQHPHVLIWDPARRLCQNGICSQFTHGKPLWRDTTHLSTFASRSLAIPFHQWLSSGASALRQAPSLQ